MAFGKPSGPPASHAQLNELLERLQKEGHSDFRDARGPMGFTQRQAGGKFTRDEAQGFIAQLEEAEDLRTGPVPLKVVTAKPTREEEALREVLSEDLAAELRRRGWNVSEN